MVVANTSSFEVKIASGTPVAEFHARTSDSLEFQPCESSSLVGSGAEAAKATERAEAVVAAVETTFGRSDLLQSSVPNVAIAEAMSERVAIAEAITGVPLGSTDPPRVPCCW